jgi:hypothetical protein
MQDINKTFDIQLHDIKPILEVQDYSFYYFLALVLILGIFLVAVLYLLYKYYKGKNKINIRKLHYKELKSINLKDTKKAAYAITSLGATFKDDTPRHSEVYEDLLQKLQKYKYKKDVGEFDLQTLESIKLYKGMIDV